MHGAFSGIVKDRFDTVKVRCLGPDQKDRVAGFDIRRNAGNRRINIGMPGSRNGLGQIKHKGM